MNKPQFISAGRWLLAVLAGALATPSFAPYNYWLLAPISIFIFLWTILNQTRKHSAWLGFLYGCGLFGTGIFWVHVSIDSFGGMPMIANIFVMSLLIGYLALYPALFGWLFNRFNQGKIVRQLLLSGPALWLVTDWLRGWVFTGFPWLWMGYSQISSPLKHFAPIFGVEGITLALVFFSAGILAALHKKQAKWLLVSIAVVLLSWAASYPQWVKPNPKKIIDVALIQGNIPQEAKWEPDQLWPTIFKYVELTQKNWDANVIVWPEAAIPALESHLTPFLENLDEAARKHNTSIITGILDQKPDGKYYNNILVLGKDSNGPYTPEHSEQYSKHHLVPFGEYVPFEDILRPLAPLFNLPMSSFSPGPYIQPNLKANGFHFEPALCYEIIFGSQIRANLRDTTDYLLTLSNDAWFGKSIGPDQHLEIAQMRALELGKPLIRDTNTGITAIVNAQGEIVKRLPQYETGVLRAKVEGTTGKTPYVIWGTWPLYIYSFLVLLLSWILFRRQKNKK